jgi:hypothetical protein
MGKFARHVQLRSSCTISLIGRLFSIDQPGGVLLTSPNYTAKLSWKPSLIWGNVLFIFCQLAWQLNYLSICFVYFASWPGGPALPWVKYNFHQFCLTAQLDSGK